MKDIYTILSNSKQSNDFPRSIQKGISDQFICFFENFYHSYLELDKTQSQLPAAIIPLLLNILIGEFSTRLGLMESWGEFTLRKRPFGIPFP